MDRNKDHIHVDMTSNMLLVFLMVIMRREMQTPSRNGIWHEQNFWDWICSGLQVWIYMVPDLKSS